jgi:hypothetical protein
MKLYIYFLLIVNYNIIIHSNDEALLNLMSVQFFRIKNGIIGIKTMFLTKVYNLNDQIEYFCLN